MHGLRDCRFCERHWLARVCGIRTILLGRPERGLAVDLYIAITAGPETEPGSDISRSGLRAFAGSPRFAFSWALARPAANYDLQMPLTYADIRTPRAVGKSGARRNSRARLGIPAAPPRPILPQPVSHVYLSVFQNCQHFFGCFVNFVADIKRHCQNRTVFG